MLKGGIHNIRAQNHACSPPKHVSSTDGVYRSQNLESEQNPETKCPLLELFPTMNIPMALETFLETMSELLPPWFGRSEGFILILLLVFFSSHRLDFRVGSNPINTADQPE